MVVVDRVIPIACERHFPKLQSAALGVLKGVLLKRTSGDMVSVNIYQADFRYLHK